MNIIQVPVEKNTMTKKMFKMKTYSFVIHLAFLMKDSHVAQINISKLKKPLEHPSIKDFVDMLSPINEEAERSPGYVWRLKSESGYSSDLIVFPDPLVIINLTVWESLDDLRNFTYNNGLHLQALKNRKKWFHSIKPSYAIWYIRKGELPTIEEGKKRLLHIKKHGASEYSFDFTWQSAE
ncbi:DUF3291 domain-containing protein [Flagellimonas meishanensis]|uniref:DUF3291 domain-containing protein n=1 Tax=Flagellimonas meishanensis TaxID=2873264 RepID=UPI001CA6D084|nr:DUF3291 domain-containing protein [[Muricauda] meishanensis]